MNRYLLPLGFLGILFFFIAKIPPLSGADSVAGSKTLDFRPISYFNNQCARCHGPGGSFYGDQFAADLSPAELKHTVDEMAAGPGGAPVHGDSLEALYQYHLGLSKGKPFLVITEVSDGSIAGEVTEGTQVVLTSAGDTLHATLAENTWRIVGDLQIQPHSKLLLISESDTLTVHPTRQAYTTFSE
ncbi:MAG: cytochrome c [Candidatus Marinimicrobia bacterium]|nr:cytochrome c [Candidatus Neomarinimicrobiota bacterium]MCF7828145.1 cytochrome c [Candidatus Neomarinimicrobiota bacterium]MCF7879680.1 cytochrome c [Candidatus Neomarinimicrobiota bacterium]